MIYVINCLIVFNTRERTLAWQTREKEAILLSIPVARLLETLVENSGTLLSRELLLTEALEKHSLSPSLNNLNNNVSLLRKTLREFDLDEAIVTIPKSGLIFNVEDITGYVADREDSHNVIDAVSEDESRAEVSLPAPPASRRRTWRGKILRVGLLLAAFAGLVMLGSWIMSAPYEHLPLRSTMKMDTQGKCEMFYLYDSAEEQLADVKPSDYDNLCADNLLFFMARKVYIPGALDKVNEIVITCKSDGKECVTYVNN